eukprot:359937-Chlamydomonas_euryale.AAC.26
MGSIAAVIQLNMPSHRSRRRSSAVVGYVPRWRPREGGKHISFRSFLALEGTRRFVSRFTCSPRCGATTRLTLERVSPARRSQASTHTVHTPRADTASHTSRRLFPTRTAITGSTEQAETVDTAAPVLRRLAQNPVSISSSFQSALLRCQRPAAQGNRAAGVTPGAVQTVTIPSSPWSGPPGAFGPNFAAGRALKRRTIAIANPSRRVPPRSRSRPHPIRLPFASISGARLRRGATVAGDRPAGGCHDGAGAA